MLLSRLLFALMAATLLTEAPVVAHEIKVLASQLAVEKPGTKTTIYLAWGHRLPVDDLIDAESLERYDLVGPNGTATPLTKSGTSLQTNVSELKEAGLYQVLVARKPSVYTFVFDGDGQRQLKRGPKTAVSEGRIDYASRSLQTAKAVIVVGASSKQVLKPAGLPIEIVPLDGPAEWTSGKKLRFQVLLDGKRLSAAELTARYVGFKPDNAWCYATTTDREGQATVVPNQAGTWVLKVHVQRLANEAVRKEYDFESFTTTLTLEVKP